MDELIAKADELAAREQKQLDNALEKKQSDKDLNDDIAEKTFYIEFLKKSIAVLDVNSLESHQERARLLGYEIELQKDLNEQSRRKNVLDAESKELQQSILGGMSFQSGLQAQRESGTYLTLEQLAGSKYTRMIGEQYASGGRYDVGGSRDAQELYRLEHGAIQYDRRYGTKENVAWDLGRIEQLKKSLQASGLMQPDKLENISRQTENTAKSIADMLTLAADASKGLAVSIGSQ